MLSMRGNLAWTDSATRQVWGDRRDFKAIYSLQKRRKVAEWLSAGLLVTERRSWAEPELALAPRESSNSEPVGGFMANYGVLL